MLAQVLTRFILGSVTFAGLLVLQRPLLFRELLSFRYPENSGQRSVPQVGDISASDERAHAAPPEPKPGSVIAPERLQSLRAAREQARAAAEISSRAA